MPDDLPLDVLTELGRVTWAVIRLEDYTEDVCRNIELADVRTADKRPLSQKIRSRPRFCRADRSQRRVMPRLRGWSVPGMRSNGGTRPC
jgi:hypothetical protein